MGDLKKVNDSCVVNTSVTKHAHKMQKVNPTHKEDRYKTDPRVWALCIRGPQEKAIYGIGSILSSSVWLVWFIGAHLSSVWLVSFIGGIGSHWSSPAGIGSIGAGTGSILSS